MVFFRYIPWLLQSLFGLLLVCWPLLDTGPGGATTPLRLGLACTTTGLFAAALLAIGRRQLPFRFHLVDRAAARMIPRRLRPYEGLWRACRRAGETDSALILARKIVSMPVKASNTTTIRIRRAAQEWIDETESDSPEVRGCTGG